MTVTVAFDDRSARSPRTSGWERYSRNLLAALGTRARPLGLSTPTMVSRVRSDWVTLPRVRTLRRNRAVPVHLPTFPPTPHVRGPIVWTVHDLTWWLHRETSSRAGRHYYGPLAALAMRRRDVVLVTPSHQVRREVLERFAVGEDRVVASPLGITPLPEGDPYRADRPYILTVATLEPRKNLAYLLEAYAASTLRATHDLRIVGRRGWRAPDVVDVKHMEGVGDAELAALYRGADALVSPSVYEGFGLPVVEAMSLGVPVICSDIPVHREVTGGLAQFFPLDDVGELVDRLTSLAPVDEEHRCQLRSWAGQYRWEACADRTEQAYARAVELSR